MPDTDTLTLPLLPLTAGVVLPQMVVTLAIESPEARDAAEGAFCRQPRKASGGGLAERIAADLHLLEFTCYSYRVRLSRRAGAPSERWSSRAPARSGTWW